MYDMVIKDGSVFDGTGKAPFQADIAIEDGSIAEIGRLDNFEARTVISARGMAVSPGFIDMHSHADFSLPLYPTANSLLHQGITTVVVGQCGLSPAPLLDETRAEVVDALSRFFAETSRAMPWERWASFGDFLCFLSEQGCSLNVAPLVGQGVVRAGVMGFAEGRADQRQMERMRREVVDAIEQGAFGLSTGLIYAPGAFTSTEELIELAGTVGERGRCYFSHIRGEGDRLLEAVGEAIRIGRETGASVQISHFKAAQKANWDKSEKALDMIRQAQAEGLEVTVDMYPYLAGSTSLASILPDWAHIGGPRETMRRLADPESRARIAGDMNEGESARHFAWSDILITSSPKNRQYEGRRVCDLAAETGQPPLEWLFDALLQSRLEISMVIFGMSEENRRQELRFPGMMFGTDGMGLVAGPAAEGLPHPRNYGAFPRVLGRYVRELAVLSLQEAVHRMTGLAAKKLKLTTRGLIQVGMAADLVVFDPDTVADAADYRDPHRYAKGIEHVVVNGQLVVHSGRHTGLKPGAVLNWR